MYIHLHFRKGKNMSIALGKSVGLGWAKVSKFFRIGKSRGEAIPTSLQKVMAEYKEGAAKYVDKDLQPNITRLKNGGYKIHYQAGIVDRYPNRDWVHLLDDTIICNSKGEFQRLIRRNPSITRDPSCYLQTPRQRKSYTVYGDLQQNKLIKSVSFWNEYSRYGSSKDISIKYPDNIYLDYKIGGPKFRPDAPEISIKGYFYNDYVISRFIHTDPKYKHENKFFSLKDAVKAIREGNKTY